MPTPQKKLNTGFGPRPDASEILEGVDITGKHVIITGGYSGIGLETTRALVSAGANVTVPARRPQLAKEQLSEIDMQNGSVEVEELDLADLESVRAFATRYLGTHCNVDILINNAGIMACPESRTDDGWELQFATNHLGHYALTNLLWPALIKNGGARVISLSSAGHRFSPIRLDDPMFLNGYDRWLAYGQAKTANSLFAVHLDTLGQQFGVRAFAVHPGGIMTPLQRYIPKEEQIALGWIDAKGVSTERLKTAEQGAATTVWAATSSQLNGMGGVYCEDVNIAEPTEISNEGERTSGVDAHAIDTETGNDLWTMSAELTGIDSFV